LIYSTPLYFRLEIAIAIVNMAMVGYFFTKFKKEATRRQSTVIKIYGLLAIMVLLRLVPRDCWLVVVLVQNEHCHARSDAQRFRFLLFDARWVSDEAFF
jgi:hypothetical protein